MNSVQLKKWHTLLCTCFHYCVYPQEARLAEVKKEMALEKYCKDSARDKINEALDGFIDDLCYTWKEGGRETGYIMVEWGREGWNGERRRKGRQNGATLERC